VLKHQDMKMYLTLTLDGRDCQLQAPPLLPRCRRVWEYMGLTKGMGIEPPVIQYVAIHFTD
jgi:hypothetical protein